MSSHTFSNYLLMKVNILLGILLMAVIYLTCKNFRKSESIESPVAETSTQSPPSNGRYLKIMGANEDTSAGGQIQFSEPPPHVDVPWDKVQPPSTSRRAFMTTGWWNPMMALSPTDSTVHHYFQPKWLKFKDDQTFDILISNKVVDTGHWAFDETRFILYLSCKDPYFNNTWNIKERGFRMILLGNTDLNITGIQVRLDNHGALPSN